MENTTKIAGANQNKPPRTSNRPMMQSLGHVKNIKNALDAIAKKIGDDFTPKKLENNLKKSYEEGDILYYEYNADGYPVKSECFSEKTASFAINSGFTDENHDPIYAQYTKGHMGFQGIYFSTQKEIYNNLYAYRIGKLRFPDYTKANEFIIDLHNQLLPGEIWKYSVAQTPDGFRKKTEYEILESYISTVFIALLNGYNNPNSKNFNKIRFSEDGRYALFNTGLLSNYATDILIVGECFPQERPVGAPFSLYNPAVLKNNLTELNNKGFMLNDDNVEMVNFFENVSQIVYDATLQIDLNDLEKLRHCIDEGIQRNRFPQECKEKYERGDITGLVNDFKNAIDNALKIARRNYKYVVPQYRASDKTGEIQFLMPIYMSRNYDQEPDLALVLSRCESKDKAFYRPETVLELAWAYNNARVICKPDETWLNPAKIKNCLNAEDEETY